MTLTEVARLTRKVAFWGILLIISLIFLRIFIFASYGVFRFFFPKTTPPPTVAFGKLTPYDFSQNQVTDSGGVTFELKTIETNLPNFGTQVKVFKVVQSQPTILFGEKAREKAKKWKFGEPEVISERIYRFTDFDFPERKLEMDIITGNFKIKNNIISYPELLTMTGQLTKEDAIRAAKSFLEQNNLLPKDVPSENPVITPLKIEGGNLVTAKSLAESQVIRVGFPRVELEKLPILAVDFEKPNIWVEVTPSTDFEKRIFESSYIYYPADNENFATYPAKTTKAAFDELVAGKGVLVGEKLPKLEIRRIYLAYLETASPMSFFIPVYVFAGDNFSAFVTAIDNEWFGP